MLMVPRWCGDGPRCLEDGRESRSRDRGHTVEAAYVGDAGASLESKSRIRDRGRRADGAKWLILQSCWRRQGESSAGVICRAQTVHGQKPPDRVKFVPDSGRAMLSSGC